MLDDSSGPSPYPTKSALRNYYLESSLPAFVLDKQFNPKPIPKIFAYYQNDTFIWNNPYRSGGKNYKYFHKLADQYKPIQERLRHQDLQQREQAQERKIDVLRNLRDQAKNRLVSRKCERQRLQTSVRRSIPHTAQSKPDSVADRIKTSRHCVTQSKASEQEDLQLTAQKMVRSAIMKQKEGRHRQLRERRAEIEELVRKSGQTQIMSRSTTSVRRSQAKMSI